MMSRRTNKRLFVDPIQNTAQDALSGKISTVERGYYNDPFIKILAGEQPIDIQSNKKDHRNSTSSSSSGGRSQYATTNTNTHTHTNTNMRHAPIMHRGYYARVKCLDKIVERFINNIQIPSMKDDSEFQINIISLGAGMDSLSFRLLDHYKDKKIPLKCYELDYIEVCKQKAKIISQYDALKKVIIDNNENVNSSEGKKEEEQQEEEEQQQQDSILEEQRDQDNNILPKIDESVPVVSVPSSQSSSSHQTSSSFSPSVIYNTKKFCLLPSDITDIKNVEASLQSVSCKFNNPTIFIAECVLVYLDPNDSQMLLQWCSMNFINSVFVSYDMISPFDSFGKMMITNLRERNIELRSLTIYPDTNHQRNRFLQMGWDTTHVNNMNVMFNSFIDQQEHRRISRLEIFDELEEWILFMSHYCYILAGNGLFSNIAKDVHFPSDTGKTAKTFFT